MAKKKENKDLSAAYQVILKPVITEKATMGSQYGQVTFEVAIDATKPMIQKSVESIFGVEVKAVNTQVRKGKTKAFRGAIGKQKARKFATISLAEGQTIDVTTGV